VTTLANYVGGEWRESATGDTYEKRSPWRPSVVTGVYPASDAQDARAAIDAAREAFPGWSATPAPTRAGYFTRAAAAIEARAEQVAQDMTAEMGKPLREARLETLRAAQILRYAAGEAWRPIGELYEPSVADQRLYTLRRPLGVVGLITPWNFPIAIPVWKLAPALIYGNTLVLKLGYEAPRTGLHVAECFGEAGLPAGVLNVLTGSGSKVGAEIVSNTGVRAISFTGSVPVGRAVRGEATARDCRVQLELGGHNPLIVCATAEIDRLGLVSAAKVVGGHVVRVPKAYPIYDADYAARVAAIRSWLDGITGLQQVGRNGLHRYNNSDHSMLTAMRAVDNLITGARHDLWAVNADSVYHEEHVAEEHPYRAAPESSAREPAAESA